MKKAPATFKMFIRICGSIKVLPFFFSLFFIDFNGIIKFLLDYPFFSVLSPYPNTVSFYPSIYFQFLMLPWKIHLFFLKTFPYIPFFIWCTFLSLLFFSDPLALLTKDYSFQQFRLLGCYDSFLASSASGQRKKLRLFPLYNSMPWGL